MYSYFSLSYFVCLLKCGNIRTKNEKGERTKKPKEKTQPQLVWLWRRVRRKKQYEFRTNGVWSSNELRSQKWVDDCRSKTMERRKITHVHNQWLAMCGRRRRHHCRGIDNKYMCAESNSDEWMGFGGTRKWFQYQRWMAQRAFVLHTQTVWVWLSNAQTHHQPVAVASTSHTITHPEPYKGTHTHTQHWHTQEFILRRTPCKKKSARKRKYAGDFRRRKNIIWKKKRSKVKTYL